MSIKLGNAEINAISIIEPYSAADLGGTDYSEAGLEPDWVRPSEWMDMPVINSGDNQIAMLMMVESGTVNRYASMQMISHSNNSGIHTTIDWGDGTSSLAYTTSNNSTIYPDHYYNFEDLPEDTEIPFNGTVARQALIQMSSPSGFAYLNVSTMNGQLDPNKNTLYSNSQSTNIVDIHVNAPDMTQFVAGSNSRHLERLHINCDTIINSPFNGLKNLRVAYIPSGATTGRTSLSQMFYSCEKLKRAPMLDTSSATSLNDLFHNCFSLTYVPEYDTSNVTNFYTVFWQCRSLDYIPFSDFSNATSLSHAFGGMQNLKAFPNGISWPTGLYDSTNLFKGNEDMVYIPDDINLSGASTLANMFNGCTSLRRVPDIYAPNATSMSNCFGNCHSLKKINIKDISSVTNMHYAMSPCSELREVAVENVPTGVTTFFALYLSNSKLIKSTDFYTGNATDVRYMYGGCKELERAQTIDMSNASDIRQIFQHCRKIKEVNFININNKIGDALSAFEGCVSLESIPSGLFQDYNSCPSYTYDMFSNTNITRVQNINLSGCIQSNNRSPFYINNVHELDNIILGSGAYLYGLIYNNEFISRIPAWDAYGVKNLDNGFRECINLSWSDLKNMECSTSYYNCLLGSGALENIFNNLASGVVGQSIDIRDNYGVSELHPDTIAIATSKGWTVTT